MSSLTVRGDSKIYALSAMNGLSMSHLSAAFRVSEKCAITGFNTQKIRKDFLPE